MIRVGSTVRAAYNLVVLGGPLDNSWTERVASGAAVAQPADCMLCVATRPDVVFREGSASLTPFSLGGAVYTEPGTGLVFTAPLWASSGEPRLALIVAGTDMDGFRLALQLVSRAWWLLCCHVRWWGAPLVCVSAAGI